MKITINNINLEESGGTKRLSSGNYKGQIVRIEELPANLQYNQEEHIGIIWELEGIGIYKDRFHINDNNPEKALKQQKRLKALTDALGIDTNSGSIESDQLLGKKAVLHFSSFLPKGKDKAITFVKGYERLIESQNTTPYQGGTPIGTPVNDVILF